MTAGGWAPWAPRVGGSTSAGVEWAMPTWVDQVVPSCLSLIVEVWSDWDDMTLRSAIDEEGRDLMQAIDPIAERMLRDAMAYDIRIWLEHVWKALPEHESINAYKNRIWQWTRGRGVTPLGPHLDYLRED